MPHHAFLSSIVALYPLYRVARDDIKELLGVAAEHKPEVPRGTSPRPSPPRPRPRPKPAFRQANPGGRLLTQLVHLDEQEGVCIYRTTAVTDDGTVATGYGYDHHNDAERAEAESIKKALQGLGFDR